MSLIAVEGISDRQIGLHVRCDGCGQIHVLEVAIADYQRYLRRAEVIQNIFPYLAPPVRELLISGTCPQCWTEMFGANKTSAETSFDGDVLTGESPTL